MLSGRPSSSSAPLAPQAWSLFDDAAHQHFRGRGAGGDADLPRTFEPLALHVFGAVDKVGRDANALGQFAQAVGAGGLDQPPRTGKSDPK